MSGLCGWVAPPGSAADPQAIAAPAAILNRFDGSVVRTATAPFGAAAVAAAGGDAHVLAHDGRLVALWGRVRFTDPELATIAQHHGVAHAVAEGYARRRTDVLRALSGSFALAVVNGPHETLLAIDRIGARPLCYAETGGRLIFGSTLDAIGAFPGVRAALDHQAIYDYVHFHMVPGPRTIHAGWQRLLPGTCALARNGRIETRAWWEMRYVEDEQRPFAELRDAFVSTLRESVREAAENGPVGTFLSGGTDSSTVAGLLGEVTGEPARTYSIGFEAEGYDEMHYARLAARHFGTRHHEYYVTPDDVVKAIPAIAAICDQPFGNASAVPTYYCARLARDDGVAALLGGDGGDELFGGNARYAKQHLYSLYSDLPASLRKGLIEPVAFALPEVGVVGQAQRYIRNASQPMPARYDNYNLLERLGPANVLAPEFLATVDPDEPQAQMAAAWRQTHAQTLINRMLALDLRYTLADNDLPKVTRACELAGLDVRFPLLGDAVVGFSATLAPRWKLKGTRLRWFFKEALRGFLPPEIITKTKHGFGLPFGPWLRVHEPLQELVGDSLAGLKGRRIVRPGFIDQLLGDLLRSHAGYYGTMAWVLTMLELWFQQRAGRVGAGSR